MIEMIFSKYGAIKSVTMKKNSNSDLSFALIDFNNQDTLVQFRELKSIKIDNHIIEVNVLPDLREFPSKGNTRYFLF